MQRYLIRATDCRTNFLGNVREWTRATKKVAIADANALPYADCIVLDLLSDTSDTHSHKVIHTTKGHA